MVLKEGRCPNCGSILNLDPDMDKGHCLFCDAVFENKTAFAIAENPAGYEFPNEPQPKYEGPSLDPKARQSGSKQKPVTPSAPAKEKRKPKKAPPKAYVHKEPIKLPEIKLPARFRKQLIAAAVIVVLVTAGVTTPLIMTRNQVRAELLDALPQFAPITVDAENGAVIRQLGNTYLLVVASEAVSEQEAIDLFKGFAEKRAEIRGFDMQDFRKTYKPITVKIITPEGGYLIDKPATPDALESGLALIPIS